MKPLLIAILLTVAAFCASAQTPVVTITPGAVTGTTITCSFAMNDACTQYCILASEPGIVEQYVGSWFGSTLEEVIASWSIANTADTTYTWDELTPATTYVIYALAYAGSDCVLYTDTLATASLGGHGTSVIALSVDNIGDTSATTHAVANDQTAFFSDILFESGMLDTLPLDTLVAWLQGSDNRFYTADTWTWLTLRPGTEYIFMAQGMNADSLWGEVAQYRFTTTGGAVAIPMADAARAALQVYPNPAADQLHIGGLQPQSRLCLFDLQGRMLLSAATQGTAHTLSVQTLLPGTYLLRLLAPGTRPQTLPVAIAR